MRQVELAPKNQLSAQKAGLDAVLESSRKIRGGTGWHVPERSEGRGWALDHATPQAPDPILLTGSGPPQLPVKIVDSSITHG